MYGKPLAGLERARRAHGRAALRIEQRRVAALESALRAQHVEPRRQFRDPRGLALALTRSWLPVTALACTRSRRARRVALAAATARAVALARSERRVALAPLLALTLADDAAGAAGVWWGCLRERTLAPLLPALQPPRASRR